VSITLPLTTLTPAPPSSAAAPSSSVAAGSDSSPLCCCRPAAAAPPALPASSVSCPPSQPKMLSVTAAAWRRICSSGAANGGRSSGCCCWDGASAGPEPSSCRLAVSTRSATAVGPEDAELLLLVLLPGPLLLLAHSRPVRSGAATRITPCWSGPSMPMGAGGGGSGGGSGVPNLSAAQFAILSENCVRGEAVGDWC
jgi:hypothetical protein